jgi:LysM repeat protein
MKSHRTITSWFYLAALLGVLLSFQNSSASQTRSVWGAKPVLAHYILDPKIAAEFQSETGLTDTQLQFVLQIARQEEAQIHQLEIESGAVLGDPNLTLAQKTEWVLQSSYNQRIVDILKQNQQQLNAVLGSELYLHLVGWIEARWAQEQADYSPQMGLPKILAKLAQKTYPRSFEVYATRYDAGERKIVALPDKCLKFANGSALQCDGYAYGQNYSVAISYQGNLVVALVGEAGPWNVDDNYWSKTSDPQPRRMFADLPMGVPEAQAAYFDGYNGGLDQFGRLVTSPVAIDISKALAADLGLGPGNNQVTVSFLWTEGWDASKAKPGSNTSAPVQASAPASNAAIGWETATVNPDGSIIHLVKAGQTLVGIATVYNVPLADLLALNGLTMQSIIQPGDRIVVKPASPTLTPTATAADTATPTSRPTKTPTAAPSPTIAPAPSPQPTPLSFAPDSNKKSPADWILPGILFVGLVGLGLLTWGLATRRRNN